ncbi:unnamed protein product, partial [Mesorhabditis spiculigera]
MLFLLCICLFSLVECAIEVKNVTITGNAVISTPNFPQQLVTRFGEEPALVDWRLTPSRVSALRPEFDRLDLTADDRLYFCTEQQYAQCAETCPCDDIEFWERRKTWQAENGSLIIAFRPEIPKQDAKPLRRLGFRATIFEAEFLALPCTQTIDITNQTSPYYLLSSGSSPLAECRIKLVTQTSHMRTILSDYHLEGNDQINMTGLDFNAYSIDSNTTGMQVFYFRIVVDISLQLLSNSSYFVLYAEPYEMLPHSCDLNRTSYPNEEFRITTNGYDNYLNYASNLKCEVTFDGLDANSQAVLEIVDLRMEKGIDMMVLTVLNKTISQMDPDHRFRVWPVGQAGASIGIYSDAVENGIGLDANLHILDFYRYDLDQNTPILYLNGVFWSGIYWTQPKLWLYNRSEIAVHFKGSTSLNHLDTGFDFRVTAAMPQTTYLDICNSSIVHITMPQENAFWQYQITTYGNQCGGAINYMFSDQLINTFNLSNVEGCVLYVHKIPGVPLNFYIGWMAAPFTIQIPANFSSGEQLLLDFEQDIHLPDDTSVLIGSSDYFQITDQTMFKGGYAAPAYYVHFPNNQVIEFTLLQDLGDGTLYFGNETRRYNGTDGVFTKILMNGTEIVYNSTLSGNGRLIAKLSTQVETTSSSSVMQTSSTTGLPTSEAAHTTSSGSTATATMGSTVVPPVTTTKLSESKCFIGSVLLLLSLVALRNW